MIKAIKKAVALYSRKADHLSLIHISLAMAVDKDAVILGAVDGAGVVAANVMPDGTTGAPAEADQPTIPYDPEAAVKLLEEAGYGPGELTVHLAVREGATKKAGTILQDQWKAIGVNTVVDTLERSAMLNDMYNGNLEAYIAVSYTHLAFVEPFYPDTCRSPAWARQ